MFFHGFLDKENEKKLWNPSGPAAYQVPDSAAKRGISDFGLISQLPFLGLLSDSKTTNIYFGFSWQNSLAGEKKEVCGFRIWISDTEH